MAVDPTQIAHLLRRTEFVARADRVSALAAGSLEAAVDDILAVDPAPVPLPPYLQSTVPSQIADQWAYATHWWLDRMVDAPKPIQEKMTLFWHGHFTSGWSKVGDTRAMTSQHELYRNMALGNFYQLTQAMAVEPAMLRYLDNADNIAVSPNQNFARELMELFTLGVGNYTEADVEASARAWTGYGLNTFVPVFEFHPDQHDGGPKTFFGKTQNFTGPEIINEILIHNATSRQVASRFIVRKLWEFFAHKNPNRRDRRAGADPGVDLEDQAGAACAAPQAGVLPIGLPPGKVRSPVEWMVATLYYSGYRCAVIQPYWMALAMGHVLFDPPDVSGWKHDDYWLNAGSFSGRTEYAWQLTFLLRSAGVLDIKALSIDTAINTVANAFGIPSLSTATRNAMAGYLTTQRAAEPWGGWWESTGLVMMALMSPEMHVV